MSPAHLGRGASPPPPLDPIVVPYDGSPCARAALAVARRLAQRSPRRLVVAHAVNDGADHAWAEDLLSEVAGPGVETQVVDGGAPGALALLADALSAGLVVLGTRGRSPLQGLLLGSTARWFLRASRRPLLVVHEDRPIERVLVGVDASPRSTAITEAAVAFAEALGARLTLATVMATDPAVGRNPAQYGIPAPLWEEAQRATAERAFAFLRPLVPAGTDERVLVGLPSLALAELASAEGYGALVVGRRGSSGADVDAWTSVAFAVASHGPHATLVIG